ncbi:MAG: glycosyltransferase family 2 protein [Polyangiaceae bacterium]|nr:glycosyltransferase family 2 protein [Polyangiaceae bacterium]
MNKPRVTLSVVMPVYNEEECIAQVVKSWVSALDALLDATAYRILVLNDGSQDGTQSALDAIDDDRVTVLHKENSGHGPTILKGYRLVVSESTWVFQVDSDDEMRASDFDKLWSRRADADAVFGWRDGRVQNFARKIISFVSRMAVRILFGSYSVKDVNTPFRLMRARELEQVIQHIPDNTFAPNVLISGGFSKGSRRVLNIAIPHHDRETGQVSIVKWGLWKAAIRSFFQTIFYARYVG